MPNLSDLVPKGRGPRTALRARIANDIQDPATDELFVTIEAYDGHRQRWGPCQWVPASALPSRGDDCLVVFDEDEVPWVLVLEYVLADVEADATATTLPAGSSATVAVDEDPINNFHFAFGIPKGDPGVSPVGSVVMFAGGTAPPNWLICDGRSLARAAYPDLFAAIGTTWGSADGASFNLPDLRKRVAVGPGSGLALGATEGLAEASRHPKHHHRLTTSAALAVTAVADHTHPGVADHTHPGVADHTHGSAGAHSHGTGQGNEFATTVENTGTRGTASTTFFLVQGGVSATDTQGDHTHPAAGGHTHGAGGGHTHGAGGGHTHTGTASVDADTTGGGPADGPSYAVLNYLIRAL